MNRNAVLLLAVAVSLAGLSGVMLFLRSDPRLGDHAQGELGKSSAQVRAARRAYDGAPPVIPHAPFGASCIGCHNEHGMQVPEIGFAPPSPHEFTTGLSETSRCRQCHVFKTTDEVFVASAFNGLLQDLRRGSKLHPYAPPVMPHPVFMRENCLACHSGPAAREPIRCSHPERPRCRQCHVPATTTEVFASRFDER